jgi:hypothetical protein
MSETTVETPTAQRSALLITISCLGAAVAVWLLPATVEITTWTEAGPERLALLPSVSRLWFSLAAAVAGAAVLIAAGPNAAAQRAGRARIVAPLSILWLWAVPFLPWLPDRAPILLVLGGPLRWLVGLAAVIGAVSQWASIRTWRVPRVPLPNRRAIFLGSLILYLAFGLRSLSTAGLEGDEPHYLIITHSLLVDRDLKIENNHARADYASFYEGELRPDYIRRGQDGAIYSIHGPGLPVLLLPGYALAGVRGAMLTVSLLAALAALAVFDVALLVSAPGIALLTWASVCLTVPFVPHAWLMYPEIPCALVVAWAVLWLLSSSPSRSWVWLLRGTALACLPWLHTKFAVFLVVLTAALLVRLRKHIKESAALIGPIALSTLGWFAYFYVIYGTINPQAPYGRSPELTLRFENIPRSLLGLFVDQKFGLLIYSPVYVLAAFGMGILWRDRRWRTAAIVVIGGVVSYAVSSSRYYMWWGGASAPARFLVPVLPLLALPIAAVLVNARSRIAHATALNAISVSLIVAGIGLVSAKEALLFSPPHGVARIVEAIQGSAPLAVSLPTFTEQDWMGPLARTWPWLTAAIAAFAAAAMAARSRKFSTFWVAIAEVVTFIVVSGLLVTSFEPSARDESVLRGRIGVLNAYDPERLRGFGYATGKWIDATGLLRASSLTIQRSATSNIDRQGHVAGPVDLPPGRYAARVSFQEGGPRSGDLRVSPYQGNPLARTSGALPDPATLTFELPVKIPIWMALSDRATAQAVSQVQITPVTIVPTSLRIKTDARTIEGIPDQPNAYLVYADDETYPEGGLFWTKGRKRGEVLVLPAGAKELLITLYLGPSGGTANLSVAGRSWETVLAPHESKQLSIAIENDSSPIQVLVQAAQSFRPAQGDPKSTDIRDLGCQVRISLR